VGRDRVRDLHPDLRALVRERADHALPLANARPPAELLGPAKRIRERSRVSERICRGIRCRLRERIGVCTDLLESVANALAKRRWDIRALTGFNRALIHVDANLPVEWHFDGLTRISPDTPETIGR